MNYSTIGYFRVRKFEKSSKSRFRFNKVSFLRVWNMNNAKLAHEVLYTFVVVVIIMQTRYVLI